MENKVISLRPQRANVFNQSTVKWFMDRLLNYQEFGSREFGPVMLQELGEMGGPVTVGDYN
jgi:hypothetical protein